MFFDEISEGILAYDGTRVAINVKKALEAGADPKEIIVKGLAQGMIHVGERYEKRKIFIPDMLRASKAFNDGLAEVLPHIKTESADYTGTIVLGVIQGNTQDNGKNMVKIILTAYGWNVIDLGKNVAPALFVEKAEEHQANFIGISIMTNSGVTTAKEVIDLLNQAGIRNKFKVVIGGAATNDLVSQIVGADGYGKDAIAAKELLEKLSK